MSAERVILVDGSAMVYRAFFALPPHLTTKDGIHTNAVFGFATMFKKLFSGKRPTYGAIIFDAPGKTTRDEKYPQYKAQRAPMHDDLIEQLPLIDKVVKANRFPILRVPGVEADDVIGTLAQRAVDAGHEVVIVSSDKDFAQLIDERVKMHDTIRDVVYDAVLVKKKWGVRPDQIVDYLALMGDASDNIPGVDGIGQKGAQGLLEEHGSLQALLDKVGTGVLKPRVEKAFTNGGRESALLSKDLATIDRTAPVSVQFEEIKIEPYDVQELNALYKSLEFYSLLARDDAQQAKAENAVVGEVQICDLPNDVHALVATLEGTVAIVPVYDGRYVHGKFVGLALTANTTHVSYVPIDDARLRALVPLLQDPKRPKIVHDAKELMVLLRRQGITLRGVAFDTRLASFLVDPNKLIASHHSLDSLGKEYVHRVIPARKDLTNPNAAPRQKATVGEKPLAEHDVAVVAKYAAELARAVYDLHAPLVDRVREDGGWAERVLFDVELPLSQILAEMELDGIAVDVGEMKKIGDELAARLTAIEKHIHALAGKEFNIGSPKQLGEILFEHLKLPVLKRTKSGYSTDAETLERLAPKHEVCREVVEYRRIDKLINTYTDVLQREVHPRTGRVHTTFGQTVGVSGRIITMDPDLQRTPVKTPEGVRIRQAFVARPLKDGTQTRIIDADWSQIELRLLAHFANDAVLVESYRTGADIHRRTAAEIFGKPIEEVTKKDREVGKTVNFSTIYGQGALALGRIIDVSTKEASGYIERYFNLYAGVRKWLDESIRAADEQGYAETLLGRRRIIPELRSRNPMDRGFGERVAQNTPIQGSAADICKLAMLSIDKRLRAEAPRTKLLLQVHDELVLEAPLDEVEVAMKIAKECMENVVALRVPLVAEVGVGASWGDAK